MSDIVVIGAGFAGLWSSIAAARLFMPDPSDLLRQGVRHVGNNQRGAGQSRMVGHSRPSAQSNISSLFITSALLAL